MKTVRELHDEAMRLAQQAIIQRADDELGQAVELARQAYVLEAQAAEQIPIGTEFEPTRSILFRSAATLAYQAKEYAAAQDLVAAGLRGFPPPQIEDELRVLQSNIGFESHLQTRGLGLNDAELQMTIRGAAVGFGIIEYSQFIKRIEALRSLVLRTTQRLMQRKYQRAGRTAEMYQLFSPALAIPEQGSFAISFRLSTRIESSPTLFVPSADTIFQEILLGMEMIDESAMERLERHIGAETAYFRNFVSLVRVLAPDGEKVNDIGFSDNHRSVSLSTLQDRILLPPTIDKDKPASDYHEIVVEGTLDYANRTGKKVGLTADDGVRYMVKVDDGIDDIVRDLWGSPVSITGVTADNHMIFPRGIRATD